MYFGQGNAFKDVICELADHVEAMDQRGAIDAAYALDSNVCHEHVAPERLDDLLMDYSCKGVELYKARINAHMKVHCACILIVYALKQNSHVICKLFFDHCDPMIKAALKPSSKKWRSDIAESDFLLIRDMISKI